MQNEKIKKTVLTGLLTAIIIITTMFLVIPVPRMQGAYVNAGDAAIYVTAMLLSPLWAMASAGAGSALADLFLGSTVYAPATLVIKGLMGLTCAILIGKSRGKFRKLFAILLSGLIMPAGYFIYEAFLYGIAAALASGVFNLIQYAAGAFIGVLCAHAVELIGARRL